eukprot:scaffold15611_cov110-Isochrysis_galbana.AAC.4
MGNEWEGGEGVTGRHWPWVSRRATASVSRVSTKDFFFIIFIFISLDTALLLLPLGHPSAPRQQRPYSGLRAAALRSAARGMKRCIHVDTRSLVAKT